MANNNFSGDMEVRKGKVSSDGLDVVITPYTLGTGKKVGDTVYDPGKGTVLRSPNGRLWRIVVTDDGTIGAVAVI